MRSRFLCLITFIFEQPNNQKLKSNTQEESFKLWQLEHEHGFTDKVLNQFKLIIYNWDMGKVLKYYKNDSFCVDFCIADSDEGKYACENEDECPLEHDIELSQLMSGDDEEECNYELAQVLCLYFMYKQTSDSSFNNNPALWLFYADLIDEQATTEQDYLKAEKYYLKALSVNNDYSGDRLHFNYAVLLRDKLKNYDLAEYYFKEVLKINPDDRFNNYVFALFLKECKSDYCQSLIYCEKLCQSGESDSPDFELKGKLLHLLNRFDESIDAILHALKLHQDDDEMRETDVQEAKQLLFELISKYTQCDLKSTTSLTPPDVYTFMKFLNNNQLLSIKKEILDIVIKLLNQMFAKWDDISKLIEKSGFDTSDEVKNKLIEKIAMLLHCNYSISSVVEGQTKTDSDDTKEKEKKKEKEQEDQLKNTTAKSVCILYYLSFFFSRGLDFFRVWISCSIFLCSLIC